MIQTNNHYFGIKESIVSIMGGDEGQTSSTTPSPTLLPPTQKQFLSSPVNHSSFNQNINKNTSRNTGNTFTNHNNTMDNDHNKNCLPSFDTKNLSSPAMIGTSLPYPPNIKAESNLFPNNLSLPPNNSTSPTISMDHQNHSNTIKNTTTTTTTIPTTTNPMYLLLEAVKTVDK
ncbi:hypothetical protein PIROE2DRAFT_8398 [Piromyces sp. E2]|nr:hypothetical protein PIROE2DRAFT_8398 [Piromyces sp. E2]|eukprot:OUM64714.1 hypothetical protein PIROE2DRAFT_8398 [Piromyces sp. E2]